MDQMSVKTASRSVRKDVISSAAQVSTANAAREQAFDQAVGADRGRLFTIALSILRDEGEAQDAVQETLVKAWGSWDSLSLNDHASQWLTRVCVNYCISRRRYLRSRGWPPLQISELTGAPGQPSTRVERVDVDRAYRRLSLKQRAAITLMYGHGYSVDQCAALMGCRPGTVRTHLARGLAALRKELGDG
jgi:RNA polymerase sigma factor (sigma-70 family)